MAEGWSMYGIRGLAGSRAGLGARARDADLFSSCGWLVGTHRPSN